MQGISNEMKHPKEAYLYALSRGLERTHYYGVRSVLALYVIGESIGMNETEAFKFYGWFVMSIAVSGIIGALIGDLLKNNRITSIIGGVLSAIGAFSIAIPEITAIYTGVGLIIVGTGMYTPNLLAQFGKSYYTKTKLLDAGFTLLYLAVNIGAFFGTLYSMQITDLYGYSYGFILLGVLMLVSVSILFFVKEKNIDNYIESPLSVDKRVVSSIGAILFVGIFWAIYSVVEMGTIDLYNQVNDFLVDKEIGVSMISSIYLIPSILFTIIASIFWSFYYYNQYSKLLIGFFLGAVSVGMLMLIPSEMTEEGLLYFGLSAVFLGLAEVHIVPVVLSLLTKYTNPKYLAIVISLSLATPYLYTAAVSYMIAVFDDLPYLKVSLFAFVGTLAFLISLILMLRDNYEFTTKQIN